jgi:hypothetical protein
MCKQFKYFKELFINYICKYCGKICKNNNSLAQHEIRCPKNNNRIPCPSWNKGKTKETDVRVRQQSEALVMKKTSLQHYKLYLKDNSIA